MSDIANEDFFSGKPDCGLVKIEPLCRNVLGDIHPGTLRKWVRLGKFPKPVRVGVGMVAWRVGDVKSYLNSLGK